MANTTQYKLQYFNVQVKGELTRYILKYADVEFEDDRSASTNWAQMKSTTPFGQLPVLFIDEEPLSGSQAIARYLGEKYNLGGSNALENAKLHAILDASDEVITWLNRIKYEPDEKRKGESIETVGKMIALRFQKFEDRITPEGFIFGNKLSYVDFAVHLMVDNVVLTGLYPAVMDSFPKLKKLRDDIANIPAIKKWIQERPVCTYYKLN